MILKLSVGRTVCCIIQSIIYISTLRFLHHNNIVRNTRRATCMNSEVNIGLLI